MAVRFYNTLSRSVEPLQPLVEGKVSFYACGPTVYDYFHIGNARSFVVADIVRRYLEYRGYDVSFAMNITDIDDKIIKKAHEEGVPASEVAEKYAAAFLQDIEALGIRKPDHTPRATDTIQEIINHISGLIDAGKAYEVAGDVFYDVTSFPGYGKLSGKKLEDLVAGARVEADSRKHNPGDFALWKSAKPEEPSWDSPWGKGRPGWHIECSVMSQKFLGETFDIHAGGNDLIFPHHENEIAQSEGLTGKPFANCWLHFGFLNIDNEKMSKSLGNFFTAREIIKKYKPETLRFFYLQTHYRSPLNFSQEGLDAAEKGLERFRTLYRALQNAPDGKGVIDISASRERFNDVVDDDLNTPGGIGVLFELVKELNNGLSSTAGLSSDTKKAALEFLNATLIDLFGILKIEDDAASDEEFASLMELVLDVRSMARQEKNWGMADLIRDKLAELNIVIEDGKSGSTWKKQ
ncbi:MAG: cysteine--tRNA ligase [Ectothiorhodospiraceae bacterium]|nr:cysteine--tRNA ligase [Ectothiorhodospiraceae bacterium]